MRTTVEEFIKELQQCDQKSFVQFQTGIRDGEPSVRNHVDRVDKFAGVTMVVISKGV